MEPRFDEPENCEQCESPTSMALLNTSVNGKDGIQAWVCDDCGHAHLNPTHNEEECLGC
jgi:transposase-like protein